MQMKRRYIVVLLIVLVIGALIFQRVLHHASLNIQWKKYSDALIKEAKQHHQPVFIFAEANYCHWCEQMETVDFTDSNIIRRIKDHFLPVILDVDTNAAAVAAYKIESLPTLIFIGGDGKEKKRYVGYLDISKLNDLIRAMK
jgi:thioredoxin-related protein